MNSNVRQYRVVKSVVKLLSVNLFVISSFCAANNLLFRFQTLLILRLTYVILTIQNYQRDALNIIYSSNIITLLYMFRVSSTHLQEGMVVHKQHMVPSLSIRVLVSY